MALNDVKFVIQEGGLGRLPNNEDHVSAIIMPLTSSPTAWTDDPVGKKYLSLGQAEADGIEDGDANFGLLWYFIREYFRIAEASELYVINGSHANFTAQKFFALTEGRVRQVFWYNTGAFADIGTFVASCKTFAASLESLFAPLVILTNVKDEAVDADGGAGNPDLKALDAQNVSVLIGGDASGKGYAIATSLGVNYVPAGGTVLGLIAKASVHQSIAWPRKFIITDGDEFKKVRLSDGNEVGEVSDTVLEALATKGYIFLRKIQGISGNFVYDTFTATIGTSDYAYIENNRVIQKAKRLIRADLAPDLSKPLYVDEEGKLSADTVKYFENLASRSLILMENEGELSGQQVTIDPDQDVLTTSKLLIKARLQPVGIARSIEVNIGYTVKLS